MYIDLCDYLLKWLEKVAQANNKYYDVILIYNLGYFVESMGMRGLRVVNKYVGSCMEKKAEAEKRYVSWMISYECPGMATLSDRISGVSGRVNKEELALYVSR